MLPELSLPIVRLIIDYMSSPPARLVIATRVRAFLRREQDLTYDRHLPIRESRELFILLAGSTSLES